VVTPDLVALAASLLALANQAFTSANAAASSNAATATGAFNLMGLCVPNGAMPNFAGFQDTANALIAEEPAIAGRIAALQFSGTSGGVNATVDGTLRVTGLLITVLPDFLPALEQDVANAINRARFGARDGIDRRIRDTIDGVGPSSVALKDLCLYARGALHIADRAQIQNGNSAFAPIANAGGSGDTNIGDNAQVGDIWSRSPITLRGRAHVNGSIRTNSTVTHPVNPDTTVVTGTVVESGFIQIPNLNMLPVTFPPAQGAIDLQPVTPPKPPNVLNIKPGSWSSVSVKNTATLGLQTGTYFFDSLDIETGGTLALDSKGGQVIVWLRLNGLIFRGKIVEKTALAPRLFIGIFGVTQATISAPFTGTVVAPDSSLIIDSTASPGHAGSFFAKDITVQPDNKISWIPFTGVPILNTF
jgi:hypothetical protein